MIKIALVYGAIAGSIIIGTMIFGFAIADGDTHTGGQLFGYSVMILVLSLIFVGVKRHRDRNLGGVIKFGPALLLGLAISGVAGLFYVIGWETYLSVSDYAFINEYTAGIIEAKREAGVSGAELDKIIEDMEKMKQQYANPIFRMPVTFLEIFPVGLVVSLVSAALLRNPKVFPPREQGSHQ
ncbi:MAG: hypothetical protein DHS20C05_14210 [Hyphococcus sp.]|nr:MAG: hypothetical protein DHS20C05_14210 [Marinicaulis sp.]